MQVLKFAVLLVGAVGAVVQGLVPRVDLGFEVDVIAAAVTSVVYETQLTTILSCAGYITSCPHESTVVITSVVAISTTICPVTLTSTRSLTAPAATSSVPSSSAPSPSNSTSSSSEALVSTSTSLAGQSSSGTSTVAAQTSTSAVVPTPSGYISSIVSTSEQDTTIYLTTVVTQSTEATVTVTLSKSTSVPSVSSSTPSSSLIAPGQSSTSVPPYGPPPESPYPQPTFSAEPPVIPTSSVSSLTIVLPTIPANTTAISPTGNNSTVTHTPTPIFEGTGAKIASSILGLLGLAIAFFI